MSERMMFMNCLAVVLSIHFVTGFDRSNFNGLQEIDAVDLKHDMTVNQRRSGRSTENMALPKALHFHITGRNMNISLTFTQSADRQISPVFYMSEDKKHKLHRSTKDCSFLYQDFEHFAHGLVTGCYCMLLNVNECYAGSNFSMMAEFYYDETLYLILPELTGNGIYKLYTPNRFVDFAEDSKDVNISSTRVVINQPQQRFRRDDSVTNNYVDLVMVLDHSLYSFWYNLTTGQSDTKETEALDKIKSFYAYMANGINLRYQRLKQRNVSITVALSSIYVLKTANESSFSSQVNFTASPRGEINASKLLEDFYAWVVSKKKTEVTFPKSDHYMLLTARDISLNGNIYAAGYANLDSICTEHSLSIVEDRFDFLSVVTATHELGHSLGGRHDGVLNECNSSDEYIMAISNGPLTGDKRWNPFMFSNCSVDSFKKFLATKNESCLTTIDSIVHIAALNTPPGLVYSPDEQCLYSIGNFSVMYRNAHVGQYDQMCTGMWCFVKKLPSEKLQIKLIIPADGTLCGSQKFCVNGDCVKNSTIIMTPIVNEDCLFGDQPGDFEFNETCSTYIQSDIARCYDKEIRTRCCFTCNSSILPIPDCIYGDYIPNCTEGYCEQYQSECCKTCYKRNVTTSDSTTITTPTKPTSPTLVPTSTINSPTNGLPSWVIPVAAGVGGFIIISAIIGISLACCCTRQSLELPKSNRTPSWQQYDRQLSTESQTKKQRRSSSDHIRKQHKYRSRSSGDEENPKQHDRYTRRGSNVAVNMKQNDEYRRGSSDKVENTKRHDKYRRGSSGTEPNWI